MSLWLVFWIDCDFFLFASVVPLAIPFFFHIESETKLIVFKKSKLCSMINRAGIYSDDDSTAVAIVVAIQQLVASHYANARLRLSSYNAYLTRAVVYASFYFIE